MEKRKHMEESSLSEENNDDERLLRFELHRLSLRRKRSIRSQESSPKIIKQTNGGSLDRPQIDFTHSTYTQNKCSRCNFELGRIVNRGASCSKCNLRVCHACRDFTANLKTDDWICIVCHKKYLEMQSAKSEWMDNFASDRQRRASITREYSPSDDAMKKIKRSWTISTPDNDPVPSIITTGVSRNGSHLNYRKGPEQGSYPSLIRMPPQLNVQKGYNSEELVYESSTSPRKVLRQSTLPNPDSSTVYYPNNQNLMLPVSPKQILSPQYSPYHTDNENDDSENMQPSPTTSRYSGGVRRQSTLPGLPSEMHPQPKYFSTSPNRGFCRSPERPAPFVRQSTFPSQNSGPDLLHIPRQLPTSPNRFIKSPDSGDGIIMDPYPKQRQMMRQATLPNPDQQYKLMPTSPPRQLSPGYRKVRELQRQHSKMIKVRSHSNEEYSINKQLPPPEGRRMLPEIPPNRSPKLVRQAHVKEELIRANSSTEKRSPVYKTFAEAKQPIPPQMVDDYNLSSSATILNTSANYFDNTGVVVPSDTTIPSTTNYINQDYDEQKQNYDESSGMIGISNPYYDEYNNSSNESMKGTGGIRSIIPQGIRNAEAFANDPSSEYYYPPQQMDNMKPRRRKSRELPVPPEPIIHAPDDEISKRKPETMRSISEDTAPNKNSKPLPRRAMSHPEKDKALEAAGKTVTPKPLAEILERQKKSASVRRKIQCRSTDQMDNNSLSLTSIKSHHPQVLEKQDSSKSFDGVIKKVIMNEQLKKIDSQDENKSQSMDERMFVDNSIRKASVANDGDNGDGGIFKKISVSEKRLNEKSVHSEANNQEKDDEHKTTLGEAEIQSAVEAAAVIFKKVVIQKRNAKKQQLADEGEHYRNRKLSMFVSSGAADEHMNDLYGCCSDDYKLVFISSDSSSKEEEFDDCSSTTSSIVGHGSITMDECDWDYFEPGVTSSGAFIKGSPLFKRRHDSPFHSPLMFRRGLSESPTIDRNLKDNLVDTDEEQVFKYDSDDYLYGAKKKFKSCHETLRRKDSTCSCGANMQTTTQYVPIPVPVPIIVPFSSGNTAQNQHLLEDALDTKNMQKAIQQQIYLWNNANTGFLLQQQQHQHHQKHKQFEHIHKKIHTSNNSSKPFKTSPTQMHSSALLDINCQEKDIQEQQQKQTTTTGINIVFRNDDSIVYDNSLYDTNTNISTGLTVEQSTTNSCTTKNEHKFLTIDIKEEQAGENSSSDNNKQYKIIKNLALEVVNSTLTCAKQMIKSPNKNFCDNEIDINNFDSDKDDKTVLAKNTKHLNNYDKSNDMYSNVRIAVHSDKNYNNALTDNNSKKEAMQVETIQHKNKDYTSILSSIHTTGSTSDTNLIINSDSVVEIKGIEVKKNSSDIEVKEMITISKVMSDSIENGYLMSESAFSSDKESETDSDSSSLCDSLKAPVQRSYDVIGTAINNEIVEDLSESEITSPENSLINQRSSDSGTDTDDTGTVVDRKKSKRFTKVFVVNHNDASSDSNTDNLTQSDSSDNDHVFVDNKNLYSSENISITDGDKQLKEQLFINDLKNSDCLLEKNIGIAEEKICSDLHDYSSVQVNCGKVTEVNTNLKSCEIDDSINHMFMPSSLESFTDKLEIFENKNLNAPLIKNEQYDFKMSDNTELYSIESSMSVDIINDGVLTSFMQSNINQLDPILKTESAFNLLPSTSTQVGKINDVNTTTCVTQENTGKQVESTKLRLSADRTGIPTQVKLNVSKQNTKPYDDNEFTCESCKISNEACNTTTCKHFISHTKTHTICKQENQANQGSDTNTINTSVLDINEQSNVEHLQDNVSQKLNNHNSSNNNNKYKSLVMITQGSNNNSSVSGGQPQVSIVTSDTTHLITDQNDSITVKHTNWEPGSPLTPEKENQNTLAGYFTLSLEQNCEHPTRRAVKVTSNNIIEHDNTTTTIKQENVCENISAYSNKDINSDENLSAIDATTCNNNKNEIMQDKNKCGNINNENTNNNNSSSSSSSESKITSENVTVVTGANTLSAVVCLEDGLADDDSWVEEISQDEEEFGTTTATESDVDSSEEMSLMSTIDREEELRGYNRVSIDFTLHTIIEESCEESENENTANERRKNRMSASELEKYFFYGLAEGHAAPQSLAMHEESPSESSSICSEGLDSLGPTEELSSTPKNTDFPNMSSSRLENYFLSGFMGFKAENNDSDGSGSVGSDSESQSSPEQRRKRLVRARGTGRSHSSSLDNLLAKEESQENNRQSQENLLLESNNSSETDTYDESTLQRKKKSVKKIEQIHDDNSSNNSNKKDSNEVNKKSDEDERKTPQPDLLLLPPNLVHSRNQTSRDSGFIGSNDDLLKNENEILKSPELKLELEEIEEENKSDIKESEINSSISAKPPILQSLSRKDSFNNWSSDEETNLMMSKMRQFFKTLVAASANAQNMNQNSSKSSTPTISQTNSPKSETPVVRQRNKSKPPQLVYFESELKRLMETVPGIRDDQVREIVEYLSSEDTWSDSYDSSDYTSSDLENSVNNAKKIELQEQISASCQQIINKFDNPNTAVGDEEGDIGDGGLLIDEAHGLNKETAFVYQKLVASLSKLSNSSDDKPESINNSPPLIAKVINHIGSRLVALMHEVSSGESLASSSPASATRYHRKLQQKISATTTEDDDSTSESNNDKIDDFMNLSRSKSHDLLLGETKIHQLKSSIGDIGVEEKGEQSDYERFSWRGSFESALLAPNDSRTKLTTLENSQSPASILAAKRRSAGDLLFNYKSLSREQLDRVRSCGSIGGDDLESSKLWGSNQATNHPKRSSSINNCDTDESSDDADTRLASRSTLPRSIIHNITPASTNSLPRLSSSSISSSSNAQSNSMQKSQSVHHILQNNVKSARFRAPGFNRPPSTTTPKRAMSAPGLQPIYIQRRDRRNKIQNQSLATQSNNSTNNDNFESFNLFKVCDTHKIIKKQKKHSTTTKKFNFTSQKINYFLKNACCCCHPICSLLICSCICSNREKTEQKQNINNRIYKYDIDQKIISLKKLQEKQQQQRQQGENSEEDDEENDIFNVPSTVRREKIANGRYNASGTLQSEMQPPGKTKQTAQKWTWNESLRSNSDKFLETLEYDDLLIIDRSLKRMKKAAKIRPIAYRQMGEEANATDVTSSPLTGARNGAQTVSPTSPVGSHTSATSDPWPSQSDDDIDRLVALHQGRHNSLSSLGVRSDSMASVYSGAGEGRYGTVTVKGQIEFGLQYNYKHAALEILIKQCKDLAAVDTKRNRSDPYVKVYLLPDKSKTGKRKTKVKKHTLNPVFDETLRFYMSLSSLESRTLWLTVWHSDMFGRNDFLGEVLMPLQGKVFDNPAPQLYNLQERSEPFDDLPVYKGDIIVGLKFIPPDSGTSTPHSTPKGSLNLRKFSVKSSSSSSSNSRNSKGSLHVLVKEAKNLSAVKASGTCDAFCKSYLLPDKNRSTKQKTSVVKRSTNPVWNHTFIYDDVSLQDLSDRALELTIWDHDRLASNEFLGGVRFSMGTNKHNGRYVEWMDATGKELSLWQNLIKCEKHFKKKKLPKLNFNKIAYTIKI
uniref:CSON006247 protein n=1 Tax=Culicoides sonorensis TaxID=179676 RepID=A0A336LW29_CULSO